MYAVSELCDLEKLDFFCFYSRGQKTFPVKGQILNILGFVDHNYCNYSTIADVVAQKQT